jgi:DNA invertase Pin-like site-specific DNA recombinase
MVVRFRTKTAAEQVAEERVGRPVPEYIRDSIQGGQTYAAIATDLGIDVVTLHRWMKRMGLRVRKVVDAA